MGSTHLPFIKKHITNIYPQVQLVDPAIYTVEQVKTYLQHRNSTAQNKWNVNILVSKNKQQFEKIMRSLGINEKIEEIKLDFKIDGF